MKRKFRILGLFVLAFVMGIAINNYAMSEIVSPTFKVASVDIKKVVASSSQTKALKAEQQKNNEELVKFIESTQKTIDKETDEKKKKELESQYSKEFQAKRATITNNYKTKLAEIDKNISTIIQEHAKENEYNIVLARTVVLYGSEDITEAILEKVK